MARGDYCHLMSENKSASNGTVAIVSGSILIAWGFLVSLRGVLIAEPAAFLGLVMLGGGVMLLLRGMNKRRRNERP